MVERCIREEGVFRSKYALMQAPPEKNGAFNTDKYSNVLRGVKQDIPR